MPLDPYHISGDRFATLPPVADLPAVEADSIEATLSKLAWDRPAAERG